MRSFPPVSGASANCVRSVVEKNGDVNCGTSGVKICRHVVPPLSERQIPRPKSAAKTVFELRGSISMSFEPRDEQLFAPVLFGGLQLAGAGPPSNRNVHVAPASVVFHTPHA